MDFFTKALLLGLLLFMLVEGVKLTAERTGHPLPAWTIIPLNLVLSVGVVLLVANSRVWGHGQVIDGHPLDTLDGASLAVVVLLLAGAATGLDKTFRAVRNIGQNQD